MKTQQSKATIAKQQQTTDTKQLGEGKSKNPYALTYTEVKIQTHTQTQLEEKESMNCKPVETRNTFLFWNRRRLTRARLTEIKTKQTNLASDRQFPCPSRLDTHPPSHFLHFLATPRTHTHTYSHTNTTYTRTNAFENHRFENRYRKQDKQKHNDR